MIQKALLILICLVSAHAQVVYKGGHGPGKGKHIVFVVADQEYRSEESMVALARILSEKHGFKCTVLLPINPKSGEIDIDVLDNIPGLEALRKADLMVLFARWIELPDAQMKEILDYTNSGRPIVGFRTSTHPFNYQKNPANPYAKYSYNNKEFEGGYGRQVLGETWISHWGKHQKEATRGVVAEGMDHHPILTGVKDVWGESDVYTINSLTGDSKPLLMGQVLTGMEPSSPPNTAKKMMPLAWTKTYKGETGNTTKIFMTTLGHVGDFKSEGVRRLSVNACYWALGMEKKISAKGNTDFVGGYNPSPIGLKKWKTGLKPADLLK